jgi:hypothetical protein
MDLLFGFTTETTLQLMLYAAAAIAAIMACSTLLGVRYLPSCAVDLVEKLNSPGGSIAECRTIVIDRESNFRSSVIRGVFYLACWIWQYRNRSLRGMKFLQGKIGGAFIRKAMMGRPRTIGKEELRFVGDRKEGLLGPRTFDCLAGRAMRTGKPCGNGRLSPHVYRAASGCYRARIYCEPLMGKM